MLPATTAAIAATCAAIETDKRPKRRSAALACTRTTEVSNMALSFGRWSGGARGAKPPARKQPVNETCSPLGRTLLDAHDEQTDSRPRSRPPGRRAESKRRRGDGGRARIGGRSE